MAPGKKTSTTAVVGKGRGRGAGRGSTRGRKRGSTAKNAPVLGRSEDSNPTNNPLPDQRNEEERPIHRTQYSEDEALLASFPKATQDAVRGALHKRDIDAWRTQGDAERQNKHLNREQEADSPEPAILTEGPIIKPGQIMGRDENQYCEFHRSRGHDTSRCNQLRSLIEKLINEGHLRQFVQRDLKHADQRRYARSPSRRSFERSDSTRHESRQPRSPHRQFRRSRSPPPRHVRRSPSRGIHVKVAHQNHLDDQDEQPKGTIN